MSPDNGPGTSFGEGPDAIVRRSDISSLTGPIDEVCLYGRGIDGVFQDERLAQSRKSGTGAKANRLMDGCLFRVEIQLARGLTGQSYM
jgi:hypothetical protein